MPLVEFAAEFLAGSHPAALLVAGVVVVVGTLFTGLTVSRATTSPSPLVGSSNGAAGGGRRPRPLRGRRHLPATPRLLPRNGQEIYAHDVAIKGWAAVLTCLAVGCSSSADPTSSPSTSSREPPPATSTTVEAAPPTTTARKLTVPRPSAPALTPDVQFASVMAPKLDEAMEAIRELEQGLVLAQLEGRANDAAISAAFIHTKYLNLATEASETVGNDEPIATAAITTFNACADNAYRMGQVLSMSDDARLDEDTIDGTELCHELIAILQTGLHDRASS